VRACIVAARVVVGGPVAVGAGVRGLGSAARLPISGDPRALDCFGAGVVGSSAGGERGPIRLRGSAGGIGCDCRGRS